MFCRFYAQESAVYTQRIAFTQRKCRLHHRCWYYVDECKGEHGPCCYHRWCPRRAVGGKTKFRWRLLVQQKLRSEGCKEICDAYSDLLKPSGRFDPLSGHSNRVPRPQLLFEVIRGLRCMWRLVMGSSAECSARRAAVPGSCDASDTAEHTRRGEE